MVIVYVSRSRLQRDKFGRLKQESIRDRAQPIPDQISAQCEEKIRLKWGMQRDTHYRNRSVGFGSRNRSGGSVKSGLNDKCLWREGEKNETARTGRRR